MVSRPKNGAYEYYVEKLCALHAAAGGLRAEEIHSKIKAEYTRDVPAVTIKGWLAEDDVKRRIPRDSDKLKLMLGVLHKAAHRSFDRHMPKQWDDWRREAYRAAMTAGRTNRTDISPTSDQIRSKRHRDVVDGIGDPLDLDLDPIELGVHKAITTSDLDESSELLTSYVPRRHDRAIADIVEQAMAGHSQFVLLHGDSSTGKTRALWQALGPLREHGGWRLWHPTSPTRRAALADDLGQVGPRTVVWLNETQEFLGGDGRPGDEIAAVALRDLLADTSRAPVLVVGTLWRAYYTELCRPPASQVRALLENNARTTVIEVPDSFADADPAALAAAAEADPRIRFAADHAEDNCITQYLAGGPELVRCYNRELTIAAKAIVRIAMDARRMGHRNEIPLGLLTGAAHAYMSRSEWNRVAAAPDWLKQALAETTQSCKGADGPLTQNADIPLPSRTAAATDNANTGATTYLLADYLDQHGRSERAAIIPPTAFWQALTTHAHSGDRHIVGIAAWRRGLYRNAAQMWVDAIRAGDADPGVRLLKLLRSAHPNDARPADWVTSHPAPGSPFAVSWLMRELREGGWTEQAQRLIERAIPEVALEDGGVANLLRELREGGWTEQAQRLIERAIPEVALEDLDGLRWLIEELREGGWTEQARQLIERAIPEVALDDPSRLAWLIKELREGGWTEQARRLIERAIPEVALEDPDGLAGVLRELREGEWAEQARQLIERAIPEVALEDPDGLAGVLRELREGGWAEQAQRLIERAIPEVALNDPDGLAWLIEELREGGWTEQARQLIERAIPEFALGDPDGLARLLRELRVGGWTQHTKLLIERVGYEIALDGPEDFELLMEMLHVDAWTEHTHHLVERAALDGPFALGALVSTLREVGWTEQAQRLIERAIPEVALDDPSGLGLLMGQLRLLGWTEHAHHLIERVGYEIALDDPVDVGWLLAELRLVGWTEQARRLIERAIPKVDLDDPGDIAYLVKELREGGWTEEARRLIERAGSKVVISEFDEDNWADVGHLLEEVRTGGWVEEAQPLIERLPALGNFNRFLENVRNPDRYIRFGRDPDTGGAASAWTWNDLI